MLSLLNLDIECMVAMIQFFILLGMFGASHGQKDRTVSVIPNCSGPLSRANLSW